MVCLKSGVCIKKYNSVLTRSFLVDHDELNGSDITPEMLREGLDRRLSGMDDQELFEAATGCFKNGCEYLEDTIEKQDEAIQMQAIESETMKQYINRLHQMQSPTYPRVPQALQNKMYI